ncbi:metallophosphoesterase family protein [Ornithinibacillus californiensis]|uniref:metallophosphoesterase family protein n=1 Tax=Ornithinibacillus californiensis TaxID=161536 RepID=UPI00064DD9A8|nr:metallophosphoesterase family protein [Ornithinibacillus californiensis]
MKIAIISDIHGNVTALEAVLEDIYSRGIERIFCLGDLVGKGPRGSECIALVRKHCEKVVRGNWDVNILGETKYEELQWVQKRLSEEDMQYLASLPFHIDLEMNGQLIRFFHASPQSEFNRIFPYAHPREKILSLFDNTEETGLSERNPDMVFYGDIHVTLLQTYKHGIICNVGSVGNALDIPSASYAILDGSQGTNTIQFVRLDYDKESELAVTKDLGMPGYEKYENELLYAKYRG